MQAAQNLSALARSLASDFEVFVPDRRGHGLSAPQHEPLDVMRTCTGSATPVPTTTAVRSSWRSSRAPFFAESAVDAED